MKAFFRTLTIKTKLSFIMFLTVGSIIFIQSVSLYELWHELQITKEAELKQLSQVAHSIMVTQGEKESEGKLTRAEAQSNAKIQIADLTYSNNEYFFIFDDDYTMVMHPIKPSLNGESIRSMPDASGKLFFDEMITTAVKTGESFVEYMWPRAGSDRAEEKMSYAIYYKKWGWGVASGVYIDDLRAIFMDELAIVLKFTVVLITLVIVFLLYTAQSILRPLTYLERQMVKVCTSKDLSIRADLDGNDELTDMANAFDEMLVQFHEIIYNILSAADQISSSSTELSAITAQTSAGMENQKSESHQVATAMTEMSATVHEVASNITSAASASQSAAQASERCNDVLNTSNKSIKELSDKINQAEVLIYTLEAQSSDISSILSVITGIAEQTNLLALNAAIEAARAGEQGRGFAVVADEVRSLSSRTHDSTNEIHNVITNLQNDSKAAVTAMTESKNAAGFVIENAEKSSQALTDITEAVSQIDEMTNEIASASEQQSVVVEDINRNIINISQVTDESSDGAVQTAESSEELARLAAQLQEMVSQFSVNKSRTL